MREKFGNHISEAASSRKIIPKPLTSVFDLIEIIKTQNTPSSDSRGDINNMKLFGQGNKRTHVEMKDNKPRSRYIYTLGAQALKLKRNLRKKAHRMMLSS